MFGWKSKLMLLLIVYFAGIATAVYFIVPVEDNGLDYEEDTSYSSVRSKEIAQKVSVKLHEFVDVARKAGGEAGNYIREKFEERESDI